MFLIIRAIWLEFSAQINALYVIILFLEEKKHWIVWMW